MSAFMLGLGFMHNGFPINCYNGSSQSAMDLEYILKSGSWGIFHEMGHNYQSRKWTIGRTIETTCNWWSLVLSEVIIRLCQFFFSLGDLSRWRHQVKTLVEARSLISEGPLEHSLPCWLLAHLLAWYIGVCRSKPNRHWKFKWNTYLFTVSIVF